MKRIDKWKKTGVLLLTAAAVSSASLQPGGSLLTAYATQADPGSPVTEYDDETMEKLKDNVLEYWEIPGLIENYNPTFLKQLDQFYYNPGSSTGLTRQQLLDVAASLRAEAKDLEDTAEDDKDGMTKEEYNEYKANIRILRARAKDLEDGANGKSAGGASAIKELRILRDQQTQTARGLMQELQTLKAQSEIADNALEIAKLNYETAKRQQELGLYSAENVLDAERALNSANADAASAKKEMTNTERELIKMLGWAYDAEPRIEKIPEPDLEKIAGCNPETDVNEAIEHNTTLTSTRLSSGASQGGANQKARNIKEQEEQVRTAFDQLYRTLQEKLASYEAARIKFAADEQNKAAADRKNALGMLSRQEYLTAENTWLSAKADYEAAGIALTAAMEAYEWAMKGLMDIGS